MWLKLTLIRNFIHLPRVLIAYIMYLYYSETLFPYPKYNMLSLVKHTVYIHCCCTQGKRQMSWVDWQTWTAVPWRPLCRPGSTLAISWKGQKRNNKLPRWEVERICTLQNVLTVFMASLYILAICEARCTFSGWKPEQMHVCKMSEMLKFAYPTTLDSNEVLFIILR